MPALAETRNYEYTPNLDSQAIIREAERILRSTSEQKEAVTVHAFVQLFIKNGPNVACLTFPLTEIAPTSDEASEVMQGILFSGGRLENDNTYYSASGDLMFAARPGFDARVLERYLKVPAQKWGTDQGKRWEELKGTVGKELVRLLRGASRSNAWQSEGRYMFAFGYWQEGDGLYGLGTDGKILRMSQLASSQSNDHAKMLREVERTLVRMDTGMAIHIAFDRTVDPCCGNIFRTKMGGEDGDENDNDSCVAYVISQRVSSEQFRKKRCKECGKWYYESELHECDKKDTQANSKSAIL